MKTYLMIDLRVSSALAAACIASLACAQPVVRLMPVISGQQGGVEWNANTYVYPHAVSANGEYIVGYQTDYCCDFWYSAGIRWRVSDASMANIHLPVLEDAQPSFVSIVSLSADGSMYTMLRQPIGGSTLVTPAGETPITLYPPYVSADGRRVLGSNVSSIAVQDRFTGSTLYTIPCPSESTCFLDGEAVATRGDALVWPSTYWREGFGVVQACSLFAPSCSASFTAISGDGRWAYGRVYGPSPQAFRYSFESGLELTSNLGHTMSVSEHSEVRILYSSGVPTELQIVTPRHGPQTLAQFFASEGVDSSALGDLSDDSPLLVSRDGRTIVGRAGFFAHLWAVRLPGDYLCDSIDFNNDGSLFDPQDIAAFLSRYSEGPCIPETATCNDIDFNNDTSLFDPEDINAFLRVYSEGPCVE